MKLDKNIIKDKIMKLDKNIIIAGLCGIIIGAGGFALVDKPKQRAFHQMPQHIEGGARAHMLNNAHAKFARAPQMQQRPQAQRPQAEERAQNWEDVFATLDTNADNKLDNTEVKGSVLARNFDNFDTDNDGFISIEEFEVIKKHHANNQRGNRQGQGQRQRTNNTEAQG